MCITILFHQFDWIISKKSKIQNKKKQYILFLFYSLILKSDGEVFPVQNMSSRPQNGYSTPHAIKKHPSKSNTRYVPPVHIYLSAQTKFPVHDFTTLLYFIRVNQVQKSISA